MKIGIRVECAVCGRSKNPLGRSCSLETLNSACNSECPGYHHAPYPGALWPNETEEEYGPWPIGKHGWEEKEVTA